MLTQKELHVKFIFTEGCYECSFCHGLFVQTNVIVTTLQIQYGEYLWHHARFLYTSSILGKGIKDKLPQVYCLFVYLPFAFLAGVH